jgi:hypothetical protein
MSQRNRRPSAPRQRVKHELITVLLVLRFAFCCFSSFFILPFGAAAIAPT